MSEDCTAFQKRCIEAADWLSAKGASDLIKEDLELLDFIGNRWVFGGFTDVRLLLAACFLLGYKKGYEVAFLERLEVR